MLLGVTLSQDAEALDDLPESLTLRMRLMQHTPRLRETELFSASTIELGALEQLVEESQTRAIGEARAARAWHMHMPHADACHPARHASRAAWAIRVSSRRARSTSETSRRVGRDGGRDETVVARGAPLDAASAAS